MKQMFSLTLFALLVLNEPYFFNSATHVAVGVFLVYNILWSAAFKKDTSK